MRSFGNTTSLPTRLILFFQRGLAKHKWSTQTDQSNAVAGHTSIPLWPVRLCSSSLVHNLLIIFSSLPQQVSKVDQKKSSTTMRTYSSFLPCLITVTSIVIGGFSAAALDNKYATASLNIERKVKGSNSTVQESPPSFPALTLFDLAIKPQLQKRRLLP